MAAPAPGTAAPARRGNLLTNKLGPLPTWAWLAIATVIIVAVAFFMRKKQASSQAQPGQTAGIQSVPDIIIQNGGGNGRRGGTPPPGSVPPAQPPPTGSTPPPAGSTGNGGNTPVNWSQLTGPPPGTSNADQLGQAIAQDPNYPRYTGTGTTTTPAAKTSTQPKPKAQQYTTVTVAKWTAKNTPWNSTLSGIADHYHVAVATLAKLNGIKDINLIYPGQKIRVPVSS